MTGEELRNADVAANNAVVGEGVKESVESQVTL